VLFCKSIIIDANLLIICLFGDMTLFAKASYTIITPKQIVLVLKVPFLYRFKTILTTPKQFVLLIEDPFLSCGEPIPSVLPDDVFNPIL